MRKPKRFHPGKKKISLAMITMATGLLNLVNNFHECFEFACRFLIVAGIVIFISTIAEKK